MISGENRTLRVKMTRRGNRQSWYQDVGFGTEPNERVLGPSKRTVSEIACWRPSSPLWRMVKLIVLIARVGGGGASHADRAVWGATTVLEPEASSFWVFSPAVWSGWFSRDLRAGHSPCRVKS
jgi:hypothetical protein